MKKRYKIGFKLLSAILLTAVLWVACFGGVLTVYGLSTDVLSANTLEDSRQLQMLAMSGPGGAGGYGQTVSDIKDYARYLSSSAEWDAQQATVLKSRYAPMRSNVRARLVRVNAAGEMTGTVTTLGGQWSDQDCVLVSSTPYELSDGSAARIDVGYDSGFPADGDLLRQYHDGYWFVSYWQSMGLVPVTVLSVVLSIALGIYLLLAAGHRADETEEDGIRLRFFDRWPVLLMGVLLFVAYCVCGLTFEGFAYSYQPDYITEGAAQMVRGYPVYGIEFMLTLGAVLIWLFLLVCFFVLRTLTVRVKAHCLLRTTLTFYVCAPIYRFGRRTAGEIHKRRAVRSMMQAVDASLRDETAGQLEADTGFARITDGKAGKAKETVHGFAQKAQGAARRAADKAKNLKWEGSGAQSLLSRMHSGLSRLWHSLCDTVGHMSVMWFGLLWGGCIVFAFWVMCTTSMDDSILFVGTLLAIVAVVLLVWALSQLGRLAEGVKHLSEGDLAYKIDTSRLRGPFRHSAEQMNRISSGCAVEVERRMKSEHLKTELLTNVSHDIKTPLTSIINYVDLLKKTDLQPEAAREYADVLERQSNRLKKLLEDLIEASKASTGNIAVELAPTDAAELLRQAVGEYSERLGERSLETVLRVSGENCIITADGRLLWRVFDNLLGNVVKYAMPGTRVYLDLSERGGVCTIVVRNISREALGVDPDELMERFVRGDASRATEGSGLGLSIARSLTECMHGTFSLAVDGDLFKVTLSFPCQPNETPDARP